MIRAEQIWTNFSGSKMCSLATAWVYKKTNRNRSKTLSLVLKHAFFINAWETEKKRDLWCWNFGRRFNRNRKSGQTVIIKDCDFLCFRVPFYNRSDRQASINSLDSVEGSLDWGVQIVLWGTEELRCLHTVLNQSPVSGHVDTWFPLSCLVWLFILETSECKGECKM